MQDPRFWGWCVCVCVFVCFSMMQRELFVFSLWILIYRFQSCFISLWSQVAMGLQRVRESRGFQSGLGEKEDWSRLFRLYHSRQGMCSNTCAHQHNSTRGWPWSLWPELSSGFPDGSAGEESVCNSGDRVWSLGWEVPLEKGMAAHSSILAWRIPWGRKESDMTEQLSLSL